jgi:homoserine O-acetyltransferase
MELGLNEKVQSGTNATPWRQPMGVGGELWQTDADAGWALGWDGSVHRKDGISPVWTWFLGGDEVVRAASEAPSELARRFAASAAPAIPGLIEAATGPFTRTNWHAQALTLGAYCNYAPGQLTRFSKLLCVEDKGGNQVPHAGRIWFAGEHLSDAFPGYMNGAAQTGPDGGGRDPRQADRRQGRLNRGRRPLTTRGMSDDPRFGTARSVTLPGPLRLDGGVLLSPVDIGYETYGTLAEDGGNAILVCHALTGDQHVASTIPRTGKPGWWTRMVGPGKPIDTDRYFVICSNVLGSCLGSFRPREHQSRHGQALGHGFPVITIRDMVRAQAMLLDHLGVEKLFAVVGGSMGGMQALSWAATFPERVASAVVIASAARHSAQNIAFHEVGRQAIMADPNWRSGDYYAGNDPPSPASRWRGWRRISPISPKPGSPPSSAASCRARETKTFGFDADFQVESYLRHQGWLRRAIRRQLLSLHHPRARLFRSGRGAWRRARRCLQRAPTRASAW